MDRDGADFHLICQVYAARRERRHFFKASLFADPAWDMLLVTYCAHLRGEEITVSSVVLAADTPFSTGLRWLKLLENEGLLVRAAHPTDGRAALIRLTASAIDQMEAYLQRLRAKDLLQFCSGGQPEFVLAADHSDLQQAIPASERAPAKSV